MLPKIAERLNLKASDKEGWLVGASEAAAKGGAFELGICFPVPSELDGFRFEEENIKYFGFYENTLRPEVYDDNLENRLRGIVSEFAPDIVHIFGTEYPHTLAMARVMKDAPGRVLVGIQGVMEIYKDHFFDGVPGRVINRVTFRDFLKKDSLKEQREKFAKRAENEVMALKLVGNVTGRTPFDKDFTQEVNPDAKYFFMNETLRKNFYGKSAGKDVEPFSIFLSQGNYPIKGAHFMIKALAELKKDFPDAKVYIAGDNVTRHKSLKDRIRLSSYGKYLLELIKKYDLWDSVVFTGSLSAEKYAERLMKSSVFVCPSTIENSPNSLGEAMLLSVPCVAARVGGIPGIFDDGKDGILYTPGDVAALCDGIAKIWTDAEARGSFVKSAKEHAERTHDPKTNFLRLTEIYKEIFDANSICI